MRHLELAISVRPHAVEDAADLLRRHAPSGVSIEPPFDAIDEDGAVEFPLESAVRIRAWLPADGGAETVDRLRAELSALAGDIVEPLSTREVEDENWAHAWKEHFHVTRVGDRLVLRPAWRDYEPEPDDVVVTIDPGRAFGTGQHETTRMCLEELERRLAAGARVLDVGCGSGILTATAALLGAGIVDAIDIDPAAVAATNDSVSANAVTQRVRVAQGSLGETWPFAQPPTAAYDLLLANISSRVIRDLAPDIVDALADGGVALVSGIVAEQEESCVDTLTVTGADIVERRADGDWRLFVVGR